MQLTKILNTLLNEQNEKSLERQALELITDIRSEVRKTQGISSTLKKNTARLEQVILQLTDKNNS